MKDVITVKVPWYKGYGRKNKSKEYIKLPFNLCNVSITNLSYLCKTFFSVYGEMYAQVLPYYQYSKDSTFEYIINHLKYVIKHVPLDPISFQLITGILHPKYKWAIHKIIFLHKIVNEYATDVNSILPDLNKLQQYNFHHTNVEFNTLIRKYLGQSVDYNFMRMSKSKIRNNILKYAYNEIIKGLDVYHPLKCCNYFPNKSSPCIFVNPIAIKYNCVAYDAIIDFLSFYNNSLKKFNHKVSCTCGKSQNNIYKYVYHVLNDCKSPNSNQLLQNCVDNIHSKLIDLMYDIKIDGHIHYVMALLIVFRNPTKYRKQLLSIIYGANCFKTINNCKLFCYINSNNKVNNNVQYIVNNETFRLLQLLINNYNDNVDNIDNYDDDVYSNRILYKYIKNLLPPIRPQCQLRLLDTKAKFDSYFNKYININNNKWMMIFTDGAAEDIICAGYGIWIVTYDGLEISINHYIGESNNHYAENYSIATAFKYIIDSNLISIYDKIYLFTDSDAALNEIYSNNVNLIDINKYISNFRSQYREKIIFNLIKSHVDPPIIGNDNADELAKESIDKMGTDLDNFDNSFFNISNLDIEFNVDDWFDCVCENRYYRLHVKVGPDWVTTDEVTQWDNSNVLDFKVVTQPWTAEDVT